MKRILLGLILGLACNTCSAAMVWVNNLTIDSYKFYYDGTSVVFTVYVKETLSTGCAFSDNNKALSYWASGSANLFHQLIQSTIIAADAQGRKVNIQYDDTQCAATAGRLMYGAYALPLP